MLKIYKDMSKNPFVSGVDSTVHKLQFEFDDKAKVDIDAAVQAHKAVIDSIDMSFLRYQKLNKVECKKYNVSPDSIMRLSCQLGYYKRVVFHQRDSARKNGDYETTYKRNKSVLRGDWKQK